MGPSKSPYPYACELVHFHIHDHEHTLTHVHMFTYMHTNFSRCEPKWIPIQFINCACNTTSHGCCKTCVPKGSYNTCVPIGSCRCICCYGPDPTDSDDHNNDAEESDADDEKDDTIINCKDGVWKCVCYKSPTKEVKLCISSPEPATRSDSSSLNQETPLLDSSSVRTQTGSTTYGSDGGKFNIIELSRAHTIIGIAADYTMHVWSAAILALDQLRPLPMLSLSTCIAVHGISTLVCMVDRYGRSKSTIFVIHGPRQVL